jgi:hypothetical protein
MNAAIQQARVIYIRLLNYAGDHNGEFPTGINHSNEAYRKLFPEWLDNERSFFIEGCAWHQSNGGKQPHDIGEPPDYAKALERGENHWAYVSGLTQTSSASLPIIADGFTENVGTHTDNPTRKGGVWRGAKATVDFLDGSVKAEPLDPKTFKVIKTRKNGQKVELFSSAWSVELKEENILNPEG